MSGTKNPILEIAAEAIAAGRPLTVARIRELRAEGKKAVMLFKSVFWVGIVIFNLVLWVPLPITVPKTILYVIAFVVLVVSLVVPILGLKKHQLCLELLKVNKETLKKKTVDTTGREYLDKVKASDRPLINAEYQLLNGSKWSDETGRTD